MYIFLFAFKLQNSLLQVFLLKSMKYWRERKIYANTLCENANIFTASYLTKKWTAVIFESKSTRKREIKRLKCSSKQQQRRREKAKKL